MTAPSYLVYFQPTRPRRRRSRLRAAGLVGLACIAVSGILALAHEHRALVLVNDSPSEPPGLYVRALGDAIRPGSLVAFPAPAAAFPYADRHSGYLRTTPIIKSVAAVGGDHVCTVGGVLAINGVRRAVIQSHDSRGQTLPRWSGCRALAAGELFVFSDRIPNSFDSRYYGPVLASQAVPYRPLITTAGLGR